MRDVLKEVLRHFRGVCSGIEQVYAHNAVGYVLEGKLRAFYRCLAVLHLKFEHAAREHVFRAEFGGECRNVVVREGAALV